MSEFCKVDAPKGCGVRRRASSLQRLYPPRGSAPKYYCASNSTRVAPSLAGDGATRILADRNASILSSAPPLPPEITAPAWPIVRPGGPGEKQLETDRRLLGIRIKSIKQRLEKIQVQRTVNRKSRKKSAKTIALVGYTNAGKSTLFNALTSANAYVADQMFATLDPLFRPLKLNNSSDLILSDTVGFIRDLPDTLVEAFLSTLEEVSNADLIIHVLDGSCRNLYENKHSVETVLRKINAGNIPIINVCNKIDLIQNQTELFSIKDAIKISAKDRKGLDPLVERISQELLPSRFIRKLKIDISQSKARSQIYEVANVIEETVNHENQIEILCEIDETSLKRLKKNEKIKAIQSKIANH